MSLRNVEFDHNTLSVLKKHCDTLFHHSYTEQHATSLYLRLVSPASARVVRNDHTTSIVSQHSLHVTTTRSPASRLLVVPIDQDDPHGYSGSYFANQTRPFSFLASQPVITKDLVFPPLSGSTPHPPLQTLMPNYRGPRWRLTSPPPPLNPKSPLNWFTVRSDRDISEADQYCKV